MPRSFASSRSSQSSGKKNQGSVSGKSDQPATNETNETNETVFSLRSMQHLDRDGKVIADPDRSNPTRARLERPLDTIRGFEAAIAARRGGNVMR